MDGKQLPDLIQTTKIFMTSVTAAGNVVMSLPSISVEIIFKIHEGSFTMKMPSSSYGGNVVGVCGMSQGTKDNSKTL